MRLVIAFVVAALAAHAQFGDPRWRVRKVGAAAERPTTCAANRDVFVCSGSGCSPNPSLEFCTAANTFTAFSGGGSGTVTSVDATGGVETVSGSAITGTGTIRSALTVNAQIGTTYTVDTGDRGKLVTHSNGSPIAVTLPQAGGSFPAGWFFMVTNLGSGTVTITPTTSTIDGAASLALTTNQGTVIVSDGTNYFTMRGIGSAGSGTVTSVATTSPITGGTITGSGTIACATCVTSAAALTSNQLLIGGGSQATTALGSAGTTTTVLHGNAAGAPSFGAVALGSDVAGTLPVANGGTGLTSGTSGGVLAYTDAGTLASSGALTANAPVIGGGAGVAPSSGTVQGNTTKFISYAGSAPSTNDCAKFDANGNITTAGAACGSSTGLGDPGANGVVYRNGSGTSTTASATEIGAPLYCADAGSNDTYACSLSPAPAAYATGAVYQFKANTANTGAATINFNSLGAKTIKKAAGGVTTDLSDNDIRAGQVVTLTYDGINMQMQSVLGNAASGSSGLTLLETQTASASAALSLTACISSTYDTYEIVLLNLVPATNAQALRMEVSTDGGSNWLSSSYLWRQIRYFSTSAGYSGSASDSSFQIGFSQSSSVLYNSGKMVILAPATAFNYHWHGQGYDTSTYIGINGSGSHATTGINAIRFKFASGNITSGTIRCYGVAK